MTSPAANVRQLLYCMQKDRSLWKVADIINCAPSANLSLFIAHTFISFNFHLNLSTLCMFFFRANLKEVNAPPTLLPKNASLSKERCFHEAEAKTWPNHTLANAKCTTFDAGLIII